MIRAALLLFCLCLTSGADQFNSVVDRLIKGTVPLISTAELEKELKGEQRPVLLDIREWEEYKVSHLRDAHYLGHKKIDYGRLENLDKTTPIVVYCSVGKRSEDIGEVLMKKGFKNVRNLRGGIFQWANEKRLIYKDKSSETKAVHGYNKIWGRLLLDHVQKKL